MKRLTRRHFLRDSLYLASSSFLLFPPSSHKKENPFWGKDQETILYPSYLNLYKKNILSQRVNKLYDMFENCHLCPRDCRVNRKKDQTGKCQATSRVKISSAVPHFGEESPLVGRRGSGTIFFSNCGLRCVFCQNYSISIDGEGIEVSDDRLAESMLKIQKLGCHNINLVTPTHYVPNIVNALQKAIPKGLRIPLVYNTSGYERLEVLQLLDGIIDIYLPDCKYMDPKMSSKYSDGAYNYPHYTKEALKEMYRQVGDLKINRQGIAVKGLILRHLVLPNRISGTQELLDFVADNLSLNTYLNIMRQYRPEYKAKEYPEIARRLKRNEYAEVIRWAQEKGFKRLAK